MTKEEIKIKWLEELRSGNHHQIKETLKDQFGNGEYGYCCLGVLAEKVMGINIPVPEHTITENVDWDEGPREIYEKVDNTIGVLLSMQCSSYNDEGWTFVEIADFIERDWNTDTNETVE